MSYHYLIGELNERRKSLVLLAFQKVDRDGSGKYYYTITVTVTFKLFTLSYMYKVD